MFKCEKCGNMFIIPLKIFNPAIPGAAGRQNYTAICPACESENIVTAVYTCDYCGESIFEGYDYFRRIDGEIYCSSCMSERKAEIS